MASVQSNRGLLMNVAYRMLGAVTEAEDAPSRAATFWWMKPPQQVLRLIEEHLR
jgi:hypothetical protein